MAKLPVIPAQSTNLRIDEHRYNPNRDIGYIGPQLIRSALVVLAEHPHYKWRVKELGIPSGILAETGRVLGAFFKMCKERKDLDIHDAMEEAGISPSGLLLEGDHFNNAMGLAFQAIGMLLVGSTFNAMRDTTQSDQKRAEIQELLDAGKLLHDTWVGGLK